MWTLITNWKDYCLIALAACLALSLVLLNRSWSEVAELQAEKIVAKKVATDYQEKSETTAKEIADAHAKQLVAAKETAIKNFKARYGSGNAACGIRANGLLPTQHDSGQADSTGTPDETPGEFVADCASDALRLTEWQQWARLNQLEVK